MWQSFAFVSREIGKKLGAIKDIKDVLKIISAYSKQDIAQIAIFEIKANKGEAYIYFVLTKYEVLNVKIEEWWQKIAISFSTEEAERRMGNGW